MLPKTQVVRCKDADFLLFATDDAITQHLVQRGTWEPHLLAISQWFTQGITAPLVLDIGANLGAYAIPVAKMLTAGGGMVHAYEPQRVIFHQLCGNIFLNSLDNVHAHHSALGESDGVLTLPALDYARSSNIGGFSLDENIRRQTGYVAEQSSSATVEVTIVSLDTQKFSKPPCLIKIDTEGYDLNVLKGGMNLLESAQFPPLLFEAWNFDWFAETKTQLFDFLKQLGYETTHIFADDYVAQHPSNPVRIDFITDGKGSFNMTRVR